MPHHPALTQLKADNNIYTAVALIVSPWPIYDGLKNNPSVQAVANAWRTEQLTAAMVESFVRDILRDFQPKHHFLWEHVLCGLAVAMESCDGDLPEHLIAQIARLQFTETPMAHAVAAYALEARRARRLKDLLTKGAAETALIASIMDHDRYAFKGINDDLSVSPHLDDQAA